MQQYVIFNVLKDYCIPKEEEEEEHRIHAMDIAIGYKINSFTWVV
jgi:hypothetical protein